MRRLLLAVLIALAAVAAFALLRRGDVQPLPAGAGGAEPDPTSATAVGAADADARDGDERTIIARPAPAAAPGPTVNCQLLGLLPGAPWTAPIQFELRALDQDGASYRLYRERSVPSADGRFALQLPPWAATCTLLEASFEGSDPLYRPLAVPEHAASFALSRLARAPLLLPVTGVATLRGQVTRDWREPGSRAAIHDEGLVSYARLGPVTVYVYSMDGGTPARPPLAAVDTKDDGQFMVRLDATADVLVVAIAMQETRIGGRLTGFDGKMVSKGEPLDDWQPACRGAGVALGQGTTVEPLVLRRSEVVSGRVVGPDRGPCALAAVQWSHAADALLDHRIAWWRDGSCARGQRTVTDRNGTFKVQGAGGGKLVVEPPATQPQLATLEHALAQPGFVELQLLARPGRQ